MQEQRRVGLGSMFPTQNTRLAWSLPLEATAPKGFKQKCGGWGVAVATSVVSKKEAGKRTGRQGEAVRAVQKLDGEGWTDGAGRRKGWVGAEREALPKKSGATPPRGGTGLLGRDQDLLGWSQILWGWGEGQTSRGGAGPLGGELGLLGWTQASWGGPRPPGVDPGLLRVELGLLG